jgi:hypothetical protein
MSIEFLDNFFVSNELSNIYKIDKDNYKKLFQELSQETKDDLLSLQNDIFDILSNIIEKNKRENLEEFSFNLNLDGVNKINNFSSNIQLYFSKNRDYKNNGYVAKIGIIVSLSSHDYLDEYYDIFQHIYFLDFDYKNERTLKNHIYNILFHSYIITKFYKYSQLFYYMYLPEDIEKMVKIRKRNIRLFGEYKECSVCLEQTVSETKCNHPLCQKCYSSLTEKKCPLCRACLKDEEDDYPEISSIYIDNL